MVHLGRNSKAQLLPKEFVPVRAMEAIGGLEISKGAKPAPFPNVILC